MFKFLLKLLPEKKKSLDYDVLPGENNNHSMLTFVAFN